MFNHSFRLHCIIFKPEVGKYGIYVPVYAEEVVLGHF